MYSDGASSNKILECEVD